MSARNFQQISALISASTVIAVVVYYASGVVDAFVVQEEFLITTIGAISAGVAAAMTIWVSRRQTRLRDRRRVFIVYSRKDLPQAKRIYEQVKGAGFTPWMDTEDIAPGEVWQKAVFRALEESSVALVLISENLKSSELASKELSFAMKSLQERRRDIGPIIPVRLDQSPVPHDLAHIQYVDMRDEDGWQRLKLGLDRIFG